MTAPVVDSRPLLAAIKAAVVAEGVAYDIGRKPAGVTNTPYVIGWPNGGNLENRSLRSRDGWSLQLPHQCYGLSADAAGIGFRAQRRAMLSLHGQVIGGRTVHVLTPANPPPLSRDDDADPPIYTQYDEWRIRLA